MGIFRGRVKQLRLAFPWSPRMPQQVLASIIESKLAVCVHELAATRVQELITVE